MDIYNRLKNNNCNHIKVVAINYLGDGYDLVTDGEYEYRIKSNYNNSLKLNGKPSWMTKESKIKRFNKECINDVVVVGFFTKENDNEYLKMVHKPTGYSEDRIARLVKVKEHCVIVEANSRKNELFIEKARTKFGDNLLYEKTKYIDIKTEITVTCRIHGDFNILPRRLLDSVNGCAECWKEIKPKFNRSSFINACSFNIGYIYVIRCYSEIEEFVKIGITRHSNLNRRFYNGSNMPYKYDVLLSIGYNPSNIFDFETESHRHFKEYKYDPKVSFHGSTECFDVQIKDEAICFIQELLLNCTQQKQTGFLS